MNSQNATGGADSGHPSTRSRKTALLQVAAMVFAAAILLPAISPGQAVVGGGLLKLAFLARMAVLIALATWFLRLRGLRWTDTGLARPNWVKTGLVIPAGLIAGILIVGLANRIALHLGIHPANYAMFKPLRGNLAEYLFWLIPATWISAAFGEEMLFRGFLTQGLTTSFGGRKWTIMAIIGQAIIFGVLHFYQGVGGVITAGTTGLIIGFVWLMSGRNLWACIIIHGILDSGAITAIYLGAI